MVKGTSQAMWIVISIIVALVVALVIIMVVNQSTTNAGKQANQTSDSADQAINAQICKEKCSTCKQIYGGACATTNWPTFRGAKCSTVSCT